MTGPPPAGAAEPALVDTHCHLQVIEERGGLAAAIEGARMAGVEQIVCVGLNLEDSDRCRQIAEGHPGVFFTVGWHPHEQRPPDRAQLVALEQLLRHPRAVAVGEVGLDQYWRAGYHETPLGVQLQGFSLMLELAAGEGKPVVIHDRDSHSEVLAALDAAPGSRGVMHCFSGDADHLRRCRERDFLASFSGIVTFPRSQSIQAAVRAAETGGYVVETDAPFLAPVPHRGQANVPAYVAATAQAVARLRDVSLSRVRLETTATARRLFGLAEHDLLGA